MLKIKIGWVFIALGVSTANSERIIVPLTFMAIGLWLMKGVVEW